jgi:hypothetical protein
MSNEIKRMCKCDKKTIKKDLQHFSEAVADPRYVCKKCLHVAHSKKKLCDPLALETVDSKDQDAVESQRIES